MSKNSLTEKAILDYKNARTRIIRLFRNMRSSEFALAKELKDFEKKSSFVHSRYKSMLAWVEGELGMPREEYLRLVAFHDHVYAPALCTEEQAQRLPKKLMGAVVRAITSGKVSQKLVRDAFSNSVDDFKPIAQLVTSQKTKQANKNRVIFSLSDDNYQLWKEALALFGGNRSSVSTRVMNMVNSVLNPPKKKASR